MIRTLKIMMIMVLFTGNIYAQDNFGKGVIKGRIIESENYKPLAYVNILLYKVNSDKIFSGSMSDNNGFFTIDKIPFGKYYIIIKMIGYEKKKFNHIEISSDSIVKDLGEIKLDLTSLISEGVEVVAEKPLMEYKVDKKVINVSRDIISQGGSAVTVLENTPSVQVDIEGNVSLRGSSNFTVYINNKPSIIQGSDALEQIPASSIESIEIITNPSAKYDPDGVSGIINVILKDNSNTGTTGLVDLSIGSRDKYNGNILINQKLNGFGLIAGIDYRDDNRYADGRSEEIFRYLDPTKAIYKDVSGVRNHNSFKLKGGFELDFNINSSLTIQGEYGGFGFSRTHNNDRYQTIGNLVGLDSFFVNNNEITRDHNFYGITADYFHKFSKNGHQLTASIRYSQDKGNGDNKQIDYLSNNEWMKLVPSSYNIWSDESEDAKELRIQIDYSLPFSDESKFETGFQSRIDNEREEYTLKFLEDSVWNIQPEYNNAMDFSRAIHSIYLSYTNKFGDFGYNLGLRGEYTNRIISVAKENKDYTIDRIDYFPTLHLSYNLTQNTQLMASYSKRINRPRGWDLEPSVMYMDANSYRVGNPELEPEYIHSYEFGGIKYWGTSFISIESYYRLNNNKITRIREIDDNKIYYTITNLKNDETLGIELTANYEPYKFLRLNFSSSYYNYKLQGNVFDSSVTQETNSWHANFNITYILLSTNTRFQLNGFYRGPIVEAQGEVEDVYSIDFAIRQELFQRQLSLALQVRDILGSMKREFLTNTTDLYTYNFMSFESPIVTLSVTYHINNFKDKKPDREFPEGKESEIDI